MAKLITAGWGILRALLWLLLTRTSAEEMDNNATLCKTSSFTSQSGYILSESYPGQVANEHHSCQCSVYGLSGMKIEFADGLIQNTCNERLVISDTDSKTLYDSCKEGEKLMNKTALKRLLLKDNAPALITFEKYYDSMKKRHGYFKLYLKSSSEMTVNCSSNRQAKIPHPRIMHNSSVSWIVILCVIAALFLAALVIVLIIHLCREYFPKVSKQKTKQQATALHYLESASRTVRVRPENDYEPTPAQTANMSKEYEEIPIGGFSSTQQTDLNDSILIENQEEISGQNGPNTDMFEELTVSAEPIRDSRIDSPSEENGSEGSQVNNNDNGVIGANSFVNLSPELVENVAYRALDAEPQMTDK